MCLGIPGKIIEIHEGRGLRMCTVDFGGVRREACIETLPEAVVGDYIIVHAGFGLNILSEEEANLSLATLRELADLEAELYGDQGSLPGEGG